MALKSLEPINMLNKRPVKQQFLLCTSAVLSAALLCFLFRNSIGYNVVALVLMLIVSLLATLFDIMPVLLAAALSALIWNFLFIPPVFTFHIDKTEDLLMFLMYFVIAGVNATLTFKLREQEQKARDREEKEKTLALYNTLLNSLSHELRTPIATIIGAIDTLQEQKNQLEEAQRAQLLSEIDRASLRLNRQVENLLNMSRLETGMFKINLDWYDLNETITGIVQKNRETSSEHSFLFTPDEKLPLYKLDIALVEEILYNILQNAVQHTPPGTTISITATHESDSCQIQILDNGKGFPETALPFVFDKFYRLPNSKTGGTGLGLSIAKGFAEALNGTIKLENNPDGGAIFTITIAAEASHINQLNNE